MVTDDGPSRLARGMREPVTTTAGGVAAAVLSALDDCVCACTCHVAPLSAARMTMQRGFSFNCVGIFALLEVEEKRRYQNASYLKTNTFTFAYTIIAIYKYLKISNIFGTRHSHQRHRAAAPQCKKPGDVAPGKYNRLLICLSVY